MADARMVYSAEDGTGFEARWHGGEYIELGYVDGDGEYYARDVINVWDYEKSEPYIPRTLDGFKARVEKWIAEDES